MAYTAPLGNATDFTQTGTAYTPVAGHAVVFGSAYHVPVGTSADLKFGSGYSVPTGSTADLSWEVAPASYDATGTATYAAAFPSGQASHGVSADGAVEFSGYTAEGVAESESPVREGDGAATFAAYAVSGTSAHGVSADAAAMFSEFSASGTSDHGVAGDSAVTFADYFSAGDTVHGVAAEGSINYTPAQAAGNGTVVRYELAGEVRDGTLLLNRTVRAYRRVTGQLVAESNSTDGTFRLHAGFSEDEFYILPIDLAENASDWAPPCANRVVSTLAMDA